MQDRMNPLIVGAAHRSRKRNCNEPGLQRSQKCGDVVEPLWCQYHSPVTGRRAMFSNTFSLFYVLYFVRGLAKHCGSTGDRAVIMAPQGLDYIVAFLGALQAGQIAVPLSVPLGGVSDERVSSVLRDASPSVIAHDVPCRRHRRQAC